jgi:alanine racemase
MAIENFLNPEGKDNTLNRICMDQELIDLARVDDVEEEELVEEEVEEIVSFLHRISKEQ